MIPYTSLSISCRMYFYTCLSVTNKLFWCSVGDNTKSRQHYQMQCKKFLCLFSFITSLPSNSMSGIITFLSFSLCLSISLFRFSLLYLSIYLSSTLFLFSLYLTLFFLTLNHFFSPFLSISLSLFLFSHSHCFFLSLTRFLSQSLGLSVSLTLSQPLSHFLCLLFSASLPSISHCFFFLSPPLCLFLSSYLNSLILYSLCTMSHSLFPLYLSLPLSHIFLFLSHPEERPIVAAKITAIKYSAYTIITKRHFI